MRGKGFIEKCKSVRFAAMLLAALMLCTASAEAANHYVRQGATGAGTGTDWTNAYIALPPELQRGDTYYIADGSYGSYTFDDLQSGTLLITIKKATVADHGTETGWSSAYGDGSATFSGGLSISTDYYVLDGVDDYGIQIVLPARTCSTRGIYVTGSFITISHVKASAPDDDWAGIGAHIAGNNNTLSHCSFQDIPNDAIKLFGNNHVIEYTQIGPRNAGVANICCSGNVCHGDAIEVWASANVTYRYNRMFYAGDGIHFGIGGNAVSDWNIFGSVFANSGNTTIRKNSAAPDPINIKVYNNTFYNVYGAISTTVDSRNNVYYQVSNYKPVGATNVEMLTDPFVDKDDLDFHLVASASALIDDGENLGSPYGTDPDGVTRGVNGFWDIGAYEYVSGGDTTPPAAPTGLSVK